MRSNLSERDLFPLTSLERKFRSFGHWVSTLHPRIRYLVHRLWAYYIRAYPYVVNQGLLARVRSRAVINPFDITEVDPAAIEYMVSRGGMPAQAEQQQTFSESKFKYAGAVIGGNWDKTTWRFEDTELFTSFQAHFKEGIEWEQTPFFQSAVGHIQEGVTLWDCTSKKEFRCRCKKLDELYEGIKRHGYLSQKELMESSVKDPIKNDESVPYYVRLVNDELAICIGRNGELLFWDGRDRLAIAKILGLEKIPVWVAIRHEQWQRFRESVARNPESLEEMPSNRSSHPDLDSILN